jgi:hypothetical protein
MLASEIPKGMMAVTFYLKGGAHLTVLCTGITTEVDAQDNLIAWTLDGVRRTAEWPQYIRIADISAIVTQDPHGSA